MVCRVAYGVDVRGNVATGPMVVEAAVVEATVGETTVEGMVVGVVAGAEPSGNSRTVAMVVVVVVVAIVDVLEAPGIVDPPGTVDAPGLVVGAAFGFNGVGCLPESVAGKMYKAVPSGSSDGNHSALTIGTRTQP
jgi:hypothetical protein